MRASALHLPAGERTLVHARMFHVPPGVLGAAIGRPVNLDLPYLWRPTEVPRWLACKP